MEEGAKVPISGNDGFRRLIQFSKTKLRQSPSCVTYYGPLNPLRLDQLGFCRIQSLHVSLMQDIVEPLSEIAHLVGT